MEGHWRAIRGLLLAVVLIVAVPSLADDNGPFVAGEDTPRITEGDGRMLSVSESLQAEEGTPGPLAFFLARHEGMTVTFDASHPDPSRSDAIVSYTWDFHDGSTATGRKVVHTYRVPGRYMVELEVVDSEGRHGKATRYVSPAETTVDFLIDRMFEACPYPDYWPIRETGYGDIILSNVPPCSNYYPWVYFSASPERQSHNPSWVFSNYRMDARVRNHPGYSLEDPVILPVLDASVAPDANSFIKFNLTFEYMDIGLLEVLSQSDWAVNPAFDDGWGYLVRGNITMDFTASRRIFGVVANTPAEAQAWWYDNTSPGREKGYVERRYDSWLNNMGGFNRKYDIYNAFEWFFQSDVTDLQAIVDQTTGDTRIEVFMTGWGYEVLLARWFYWGRANYTMAVNSPYGRVEPQGWMPMELLWAEQTYIGGTIKGSLDLDYRAIIAYHMRAWSNWGHDWTPGTADDIPVWEFAPFLMDYVPRSGSGSPAASAGLNSELRWYEGLTSIHGSPGSYAWGQAYEYMGAPTRWRLDAGSTLTLALPRFEVEWFDPARSMWNPELRRAEYARYKAPITLRYVCESLGTFEWCSPPEFGDYYLWDNAGKVLSMAGPRAWVDGGLPLAPSPRIEFAPVDNEPPEVSITYPEPHLPVGDRDVRVSWTSSDVPSGVKRFEVQLDDEEPISLPHNAHGYLFLDLPEGTHRVTVRAYDASNNVGSTSTAFTVDVTPPVIVISNPRAGARLGYSTLEVSWDVTDELSGLDSLALSLDEGSPLVLPLDARSYTLTGIGSGPHTVELTVIDRAGNEASASVDFTVGWEVSFLQSLGDANVMMGVAVAAAIMSAIIALILFKRRR
jgi:PKD repeat protein